MYGVEKVQEGNGGVKRAWVWDDDGCPTPPTYSVHTTTQNTTTTEFLGGKKREGPVVDWPPFTKHTKSAAKQTHERQLGDGPGKDKE